MSSYISTTQANDLSLILGHGIVEGIDSQVIFWPSYACRVCRSKHMCMHAHINVATTKKLSENKILKAYKTENTDNEIHRAHPWHLCPYSCNIMSHRGGERAYRKDRHANRCPEQDDDCENWVATACSMLASNGQTPRAPCLSQIKLCLLVPLPLDPEGLWGFPLSSQVS